MVRFCLATECPPKGYNWMIEKTFFAPASWKKDWKLLLVVSVVVFAGSFGFRYLDYPAWDHEQYKVGSEFIMATHDAYHWLAGALGVGHASNTMMAEMPRLFSQWTGVSVGLFGFWAPAVFASLVAVVVVLWAWTLGGLPAGLCAGTLVTLAPGFYFRTRLGYYDTDIATLLFPLLISWVLAHWLQPLLTWPEWLRKRFFCARDPKDNVVAGDETRAVRRRRAKREKQEKGRVVEVSAISAQEVAVPVFADDIRVMFWVPVAAGLLVRVGSALHSTVSGFSQILLCLSVALIFLMGRKGLKPQLLWGMVIFILVAFWGWLGLAVSLCIIALGAVRSHWFAPCVRTLWPACIVLAMLFLYFDVVGQIWGGANFIFSSYIKSLAQTVVSGEGAGAGAAAVATPVVYPAITQSVIEAQDLAVEQVLGKIYPTAVIAGAGLLGFLVVMVLRPSALFLLPLGVFALSAVKMGARTVMFGGPVFALGLALPLAWAARRYLPDRPWRSVVVYGLEAALAVLLLIPYLNFYGKLPVTPILSKEHALALKALEPVSPANSRVWTWWDWGYATHYYARRMSFADGARHSGEYVFPLGVALTTPNPRQASQLIKYCAAVGYEPWRVWNAKKAQEIVNQLRQMAVQDLNIRSGEKQYLVVAKENLPLIPWISFYGSWNFFQQSGIHGFSRAINERFTIDNDKGLLLLGDRKEKIELKSIDFLSREGRTGKTFNNSGGFHAIISQETGSYYIMDDLSYNSMMVQLLIAHPKDVRFTPYFRLVFEGFPFVRIYEVL